MILLAGIYYPSRVLNQKTHFEPLQTVSPATCGRGHISHHFDCLAPQPRRALGGHPSTFDIQIQYLSSTRSGFDIFSDFTSTFDIPCSIFDIFSDCTSTSDIQIRYRRFAHGEFVILSPLFPLSFFLCPFSFVLLTFSFCFPSSRSQLKTKHLKLKTISSLSPNVGAVREPP